MMERSSDEGPDFRLGYPFGMWEDERGEVHAINDHGIDENLGPSPFDDSEERTRSITETPAADEAVNEEVNILIASLPADEWAELADDRKFVEGLGCDLVPEIGFVSFGSDMTDEQKAQAIDYLRWRREQPDKLNDDGLIEGEVVDDKEK